MEIGSLNIVVLVASLMVAATPILMAAIGELVVEKAGVLNLGVEGMMITGAIAGFAVAVESGSPLLGFVAAAIAGAALSILFAILTQFAQANQVASGLSLTRAGLPATPGYRGVWETGRALWRGSAPGFFRHTSPRHDHIYRQQSRNHA